MNLPTTTNTPTKNTQTALRSLEPNTGVVTPKKNAFQHKVRDLSSQLNDATAAKAIAQLPAAPSVTSIAPVSQPNQPHRLNNNDVQTFKQGQLIYRADDLYNDSRQNDYKAKFFALNKEAATNNYGTVQLQFELLQDVKLLRLDQNVDGFKTWLDNSGKPEADKNILHKNFGYPKAEAPNAERKRNSVGDADRTMLEMIQNYAKETKQEIHGYYNDLMIKDDRVNSESGPSKFHAEIALFDQTVFSKPNRIDHLTAVQVKELNAQAQANAESRELRQKKKRGSREISSSTHEPSRINSAEQAGNFKARRLTF